MKLPIQVPAVARGGISWPGRAQGLVQGITPQDQRAMCNGQYCPEGEVCCPADPSHPNAFCYQCAPGQTCCGPDMNHTSSYCATACGG